MAPTAERIGREYGSFLLGQWIFLFFGFQRQDLMPMLKTQKNKSRKCSIAEIRKRNCRVNIHCVANVLTL